MTPTIPAVVNGHCFLRPGSPVENTKPVDLGWEDTEVPAGTPGVVLYVDDGNDLAWVAFVDCDGKGPILMPVPLDDLSLRLDDATGRAHLAWWLAEAVNLKRDAVWDGRWHIAIASAGVCWLHDRSLPADWRVWTLATWNQNFRHTFAPAQGETRIADLNDLDPNNPRLLPDGSRWIDAEALRLVALHVAGATEAP